ncbi:MAG: aldo/keto reductase [Acutalibacter sp.]|nr:aldo/keto reductase [Acutalibacter sp.]
MQTRTLGKLEVSSIGTGCMGFSHGYGEAPKEEYSIEAIHKAYDFGCTFFDTAEGYGTQQFYPGHNEEIVGKAVKDFRKDVVIATKFHFHVAPAPEENLYDVVRKHLDASMKKLQIDYVDLYYLHRVHGEVPVEEVAAVMGQLIKEGLIRGWGLSQVGADTLRKAHEVTPVSAVQNIYSMVERDCEKEIFPYCLENGIGVVPFSPIASGFLSGKLNVQSDFTHHDDVRSWVPQLTKENIAANQPIIDLLSRVAAEKNATNAQISLAWMLHKYPNCVPIPGSKNQERILENLGAWNVTLTVEEFSALEQALDAIPVHGHRGHVEYDGNSMRNWNKENK